MAQGISLHIGLNQVDPNAYNGWSGVLGGCINDANAMKAIADQFGYKSDLLTDDMATSYRVIEKIGQAARSLGAGDIFLLTYSGHGGQVQDVNRDETDALDETWVLYDRMLVDDELYSLWSQFAAGVHIFMLSDSCHSGTVAKALQYQDIYSSPARSKGGPPTFKAIPEAVRKTHCERYRETYSSVQWVAGANRDADVSASVILISGCQDAQLSADGAVNGLFTTKLLEVWNNGAFDGDYVQFHKQIAMRMPPEQSPNYCKVGQDDAAFEAAQPFAIESGAEIAAGTGVEAAPGTAPEPSETPYGAAEPSGDRPTLRRGDKGSAVVVLQKLLIDDGYRLIADGIFGAETEGAVRWFQRDHGLYDDGIVGQQTWDALYGGYTPTDKRDRAQQREPAHAV